MGPLWFLLALFWVRLAYWLIQSLGKWTLIMSLLIGFAAYLSSILWMENRVFFIHGLCALPFVAIGGELQKYTASEEWHKKYQNWVRTVLFVCIVCWVLAMFVSHLEMRACSFGCWPLDIAGACGGTFILWLLAKCFMENQKICNFAISKAVICCGRYSMAILCMHSLEWKALLRLEQMLCSGWLLLLLRFTITIVLAAIVVYTPIFNKIYR